MEKKHSSKYDGPFEQIMTYTGAIIGIGLGISAGIEAIDYVNQLPGDLGVLEMLVKNHPIATGVISAGIGAEILSLFVGIPGVIIDYIAGTHYNKS